MVLSNPFGPYCLTWVRILQPPIFISPEPDNSFGITANRKESVELIIKKWKNTCLSYAVQALAQILDKNFFLKHARVFRFLKVCEQLGNIIPFFRRKRNISSPSQLRLYFRLITRCNPSVIDARVL